MPNWCENHLRVTGNHEDVTKFLNAGLIKEKGKEDVWAMSKYYPIPKELQHTIAPSPQDDNPDLLYNRWEIQSAKQDVADGKDVKIPKPIKCKNATSAQRKALMKKHGVDNWYDWTTSRWGTKWDCDSNDCGFTYTAGEFNVSFSSAWAPPERWMEKVSADYPTLKFELTYMETGMWFAGKVTMRKGKITQNLEGEPLNLTYDGKEVENNEDENTNSEFEFKVIETGELVSWDDVETTNPFENM